MKAEKNGDPHRVVVIDDDPDIRTVISLALEREGYEVLTYDDGQSALEALSQRPKLILLDYMMPRLNAAGFLWARNGYVTWRDVPVVVISAYPELVDTVVTQTVGVLYKPIDLDILIECVNYHCQQ